MDVLLNELAFQKVLLSSIDDTVQNRQAAEEEVCAEIRNLEKQIRALKRCTTTTASYSQSSGSSQPSQTQYHSSSKTPGPSTGEDLSSAQAMDGYLSKCFPPSEAPTRTFEGPFSFSGFCSLAALQYNL
jgi:hypothetical protein